MLREAGRPAVDTHVGALAVSFAAGPVTPVARLVVGRVELRVLAASHQVVVPGPGPALTSPPGHVETVACGVAGGAAVRDGGRHDHGGWALAFEVVELGRADFGVAAEGWLARGREDAHTLAVRFAGHPYALTALSATVADVGAAAGADVAVTGWTSVHLYPGPGGGGTVVTGRTRAVPVAVAVVPGSVTAPAGVGVAR
jgi:hypothetical protein